MVRNYALEGQSIERVQRAIEFCADLLERESEGLECEHDTSMTADGVMVCTDDGCPLAWCDRMLVADWHTAFRPEGGAP